MSWIARIYGEMRDKYGFDDGAIVPDGAGKARQAIVDVINSHLPKEGAKATPFDRPGLHNWCMICYANPFTGEKEWDGDSIKEPEDVNEILIKAEENGEIEIWEVLKVKVRKPKGGKRIDRD